MAMSEEEQTAFETLVLEVENIRRTHTPDMLYRLKARIYSQRALGLRIAQAALLHHDMRQSKARFMQCCEAIWDEVTQEMDEQLVKIGIKPLGAEVAPESGK